MNRMKTYLLSVLSSVVLTLPVYAQDADSDAYALMSARDMQANSVSNITITNKTNQTITASGLFISSFDANDCSVCTGSIMSGDNAGGSVVSLVTFKPNQSVAIGQNYLYNMIYNGIYYIKTNISTPCALPGCSWPGDNPIKWCITINATSLDSDYTYSEFTNGSNPPANTPPYGDAGNSSGYNYKYDLVDPNTLGVGNACLGPVTCDDETLTCSVSTHQDESFEPY